MSDRIREYHKMYADRMKLFKSHGYDVEDEREAIFEQAQPVKGNILEVGTGKGHFAMALARKGYRFVTIDNSCEEQEFAKMNAQYFQLEEYIDFQVSDAQHMTFDDQSFDTIFCVNVLHHLQNPYEVADELIRVLRFGGKIIISDFNRQGMALVDKIHCSEGRKHPQGKILVNDIANYLKKREFRIDKHRTLFQETIVAFRKRPEAAA